MAHHYHDQLRTEADLDKIKMPEITHDAAATEKNYQRLVGLFGDILPIVKRGVTSTWFAPWDALAQFRGVQPAMEDLALRPDFIHATMERLVSAYLRRWDQYETLGLLSCNANKHAHRLRRSGICGHPPRARPRRHARAPERHVGQRYGAVLSPSYHPRCTKNSPYATSAASWSALGLNYYGCCEPLHNKVEVLKSVPRLRKISMSPYIDLEKAIKNVRRAVRLFLQAQPGGFRLRRVERGARAPGADRGAGESTRLHHGSDPEGCLHGALPSRASLGVDGGRARSNGAVRLSAKLCGGAIWE